MSENKDKLSGFANAFNKASKIVLFSSLAIVGGLYSYAFIDDLSDAYQNENRLEVIVSAENADPASVGLFINSEQCGEDQDVCQEGYVRSHANQISFLRDFKYDNADECVRIHGDCNIRGENAYVPHVVAKQYLKTDPENYTLLLYSTNEYGKAIRADGVIIDITDIQKQADVIYQDYFQNSGVVYRSNLEFIQMLSKDDTTGIRMFQTIEQCVQQGSSVGACNNIAEETAHFATAEASAMAYDSFEACEARHGECISAPFSEQAVIAKQVATMRVGDFVTPLYASIEVGKAIRGDAEIFDITNLDERYPKVSQDDALKRSYQSTIESIANFDDREGASIWVRSYTQPEQCVSTDRSLEECQSLADRAAYYANHEMTSMRYDSIEACISIHGECVSTGFNNQAQPKQVGMQTSVFGGVVPLYAHSEQGMSMRSDGVLVQIPEYSPN